ncbi:hypothetical protein SEMRO_2996_G341820.1 [Seminavis robusta]|uniref:Uncharacterized protein n=1 Tax=Seminavis robusta TaxID=568900 RepID=A0A9N8I0Z9_9STRA|nr:hypothetical protein SEMRO_2996_G341820.1 [Seminavis robusta]|eukprot:Sro2996_g341820.1 n/a (271) ;mRNA; f:6659-7552
MFCNGETDNPTGNSLIEMMRKDLKAYMADDNTDKETALKALKESAVAQAEVKEGYKILEEHALRLAAEHCRTCQHYHIDIRDQDIKTDLLDKDVYVFSVFMPLQEHGMFLKLITNPKFGDTDDKMAFVQHGSYLMMPATAWHSGSFSTNLKGNLRAQIYVCLTPEGMSRGRPVVSSYLNDTIYQGDSDGVLLLDEHGRRPHVWDGAEAEVDEKGEVKVQVNEKCEVKVQGFPKGSIVLSHSGTDLEDAILHESESTISKVLMNLNDVLLL